MKRVLCSLFILTLAACNGHSDSYVTYFLNKGYVGRPINDFFGNYGYPAGVFEQANGSKVYRWVSTQYKIDPTSAVPTTYISSNGKYQIVDVYRGSTEHHYCEIRVTANSAEIITDFAVAVDTPGEWSTSRCSEIFDKIYP